MLGANAENWTQNPGLLIFYSTRRRPSLRIGSSAFATECGTAQYGWGRFVETLGDGSGDRQV
jgi:hypothetical protein